MKRILAIIMAISLCIVSLSIGANAFAREEKDLSEYTIEDLFNMSTEEK